MHDDVDGLLERIDFSGVARVESPLAGQREWVRGFADRANEIPVRASTRFCVASATKGLTALTIMALIEDGLLSSDQTVAELLGDRLPLIDRGVTVDQLLTHTSGIGDYIDEEGPGDIDDHILGVSAHTLLTPLDYTDLLAPLAQVSAPGSAFTYNNSGYVVLSMIVEMLSGSYHRAVEDRVLEPAGMTRSGFFRSDSLPADVALSYLEDGRTNVFHLPVIGAGDGGIFLCVDDVSRLWEAVFDGTIVPSDVATAMTSVRSSGHRNGAYGIGFWLRSAGDVAWLEGMDAGVSFKSARHLTSGATYTVLANTFGGAWPVAELLDDRLV